MFERNCDSEDGLVWAVVVSMTVGVNEAEGD